MTFRFDDICLNTDVDRLSEMVRVIRRLPKSRIIFAVSPMGHDMHDAPGLERERIFPAMFHVEHDHRVFYKPDWTGVPEPKVLAMADVVAAHGLIHVDHRLLSRKVQELSIVAACALVKSQVFMPPFNKWNEKTREVCSEHGIELMTAFDWKHLKFHAVSCEHENYYVHTHDLSLTEFTSRFAAVL